MRNITITAAVGLAVALSVGCRDRAGDEKGKTTTSAAPAETAKDKAGTTETTSGEAKKDTAAPSGQANLPPFEGELDVKVAGRTPASLEYAMKGDKIRIGLPGKGDKTVDAIVDTDDQKATILLNDREEYVEVDLKKLATKAQKRVEEMDVERTGKTATVSGRTCEEWQIRDRDFRLNACVVKGAPYFDLDAVERQGNFRAPPWVHRIVDAGYVPLRVTINDAKGKTLGSSEMSDVSKKVDASKFEVPAGYKKVAPGDLTAPKK